MVDRCFVGLDVNSRSPYYTLVAIDADMRCVLDLSADWEEISVALTPFPAIMIAINSPISPNNGQLRELKRKKHKPGKWPDIRCVEYELEEYGAPIYHTPQNKKNLLAAQQHGFTLVEQLNQSGFLPYDGESPKTYLEVPAETAFWSVERRSIFENDSLIGRIQRQLLLIELGMELPDPMVFFEEVTRFKLLNGKAPVEMIYELPRLNAWMNAYTALRIYQTPARAAQIGYPQEGVLYLPFPLPDWEEDNSVQSALF